MTNLNYRLITAALLTLSLAGAAVLFSPKETRAQSVVTIGDEWLLSDEAFAADSANAAALAQNVAAYLTGGATSGDFLAYSSNVGLTGGALAATMTGNGFTWTVSAAQPFTLATLSQYDAVFLSGISGSGGANAAVLQSYLNSGGSILIMAGTGEFGTAPAEAAAWSPFLNSVGLEFGSTWFPVAGFVNVPTAPGSHPLRQNVTGVRWGFGQTAFAQNPANPFTRNAVIGQFGPLSGDQPIIATYQIGSSAAPEPGTLSLLALAGLVATVTRRRR